MNTQHKKIHHNDINTKYHKKQNKRKCDGQSLGWEGVDRMDREELNIQFQSKKGTGIGFIRYCLQIIASISCATLIKSGILSESSYSHFFIDILYLFFHTSKNYYTFRFLYQDNHLPWKSVIFPYAINIIPWFTQHQTVTFI